MWQFIQVPRRDGYGNIPGKWTDYSGDFPLWRLLFEIQKGRLSFRLTAPYSKERRMKLSEHAKKHGINHGEKLMKGFD